jgi:hypothetical protein
LKAGTNSWSCKNASKANACPKKPPPRSARSSRNSN